MFLRPTVNISIQFIIKGVIDLFVCVVAIVLGLWHWLASYHVEGKSVLVQQHKLLVFLL